MIRARSFLALVLLVLCAACDQGTAIPTVSQLQRLQTWQNSNPNPLGYKPSDVETELTQTISKILDRENIKICYGIDSPSYFFEHVLPLHAAMPGPFCGLASSTNSQNIAAKLRLMGFPESDIFLFDRFQDLQDFAKENRNMLIAAAWTTDHELYRMSHISHGVDEDNVFCSDTQIFKDRPPGNDLSLVFTKFNANTRRYSLEDLRAYYEIDARKKTILLLTTFSDSFLDFRTAPLHISQRGLHDLIKLKEKYNIIIRPHPLIGKDTYRILESAFIIAPNGQFPSFIPFLELADLVIGELGSSSSVPTSRHETPLIVFRPKIAFESGLDYHSVAIKFGDLLHSDKTCVLQNEDNFDLRSAVEEAFANSTKSNERAKAREAYFRYWYGCVDGYENYRVALKLLTQKQADLANLKDLYQSLPLFQNRALCQP